MNSLVTINNGLLWIILGAFGALTAGTMVQLRRLRGAAAEEVERRLDSLRSWWIVGALVSLGVAFGQLGVTLLMASVSWLSLREFFRLVGVRSSDRHARNLSFTLIPLHYLLIYGGWIDLARGILPLSLLLLVGSALVLTGETKGFARAAATFCWGAIVTVYALSHAVMLVSERAFAEPVLGPIGLFVFLILLTESNDIAQALVGRRVGRRKITPTVSPNKTWEGLAGGVIVTLVCGMLFSPWLLPAGAGIAMGAGLGLAISITGFLGDIHMSALKRDRGVKDSGDLLPGQGGILDRVDSLTFTAPVFFYLMKWLFYA